MSKSSPGGRIDGRLLRTERSRQAVVEAVVALLEEGEVGPTARMVSERSGVSHSTLFRLYADLDTLYSDAIAHRAARIRGMFVDFDVSADRTARITALVDNRARIYEAIAPVRRQAVVLAAKSEPVREGLRRFDAYHRDQVKGLFANEFSNSEPLRVSLVASLTSWDMWQRLREGEQLPAPKAKAALISALDALLEG